MNQQEFSFGNCEGYGCPILRQYAVVEALFVDISSRLVSELEATWRHDYFKTVLEDSAGCLESDAWSPHLYYYAASLLRAECKPDRFWDSQTRLGLQLARKFERLARETKELYALQKFELARRSLAA